MMPAKTRMIAAMNVPDSLVSAFQADKEMIEQMGYDTSDMVECGENYLVGDDLIFSKARLEEYRLSPRMEPKISSNGTLSETSQRIYLEIYNYDFSSSMSSSKDLIMNATKAWNEIGDCNLNISSDYDATPDKTRYPVELHIGDESILVGGPNIIMRCEPSFISGGAGAALYINTACPLWEEISSDQKK